MFLVPTALAICLLAAEPSRSPSQEVKTAEPRTLAALAKDLSTLLKQEATAKSLAERSAAIYSLTELYGELMRDPRMETNDYVKNYRGELYNRLIRTRDDLKRQLAQDQRRGRSRGAVASESLGEVELAARQCLAATMATSDYAVASPNLAFARGGQAVFADNGQALVDLIERTINPAFWDTNGGPGSIVYYAPLRCLVVTATLQIHEEIGGVVGGLQAGN